MENCVLELSGICKSFSGNQVLKDVSLKVKKGEVLGLVGENGAGKSTLVKIITGVYSLDAGALFLDGTAAGFSNPLEALAQGIAIIHQELNLFQNLRVFENIYLDREEYRDRLGRIDIAGMKRDAGTVIASLGADIDPEATVADLSIREQQIVEIARAISANVKVLIMDEPSAALTEEEVQKMFLVIEKLKGREVSIIYVSHRMHEIKQICERVAVLRDGVIAGVLDMKGCNISDIVTLMVGRDIGNYYPHTRHTVGEVVLEAENLCCRNVMNVSLQVRRGEILCLYGLAGSGTTELAECLFGIEKAFSGTVRVLGKAIKGGSPDRAIRQGIGYIPSDRRSEGIIPEMSLEDNLILASYKEDCRYTFLRRGLITKEAQEWRDELHIRSTGTKQRLSLLSGGNQQKVVLAKWLKTKPHLLIMNEPTRGVDIGAKAEIYALINGLAEKGLAVLLISSEVPEVLGMADRVLVMNRARIAGEYPVEECSQELLLQAASGGGVRR